MIAVPSIFVLFLTAGMSIFGIAVLRDPRHKGARMMLAGAAVVELFMAIGLALLIAMPHRF